MGLSDIKAAARKAAFARRKAAHAAAQAQEQGQEWAQGPGAAATRLAAFLAPHKGRPLAGYMPIRSEIDPLAVMAEMARHGPVAVPVIQGAGKALKFRAWAPGCALEPGPFGAMVPASGDWLTPEVLIVPLVAFDRHGGRLGYGGGFYDRTLQALRAARPTLAVGYAYAAQEADSLPLEPTDQPLDAIVTEAELIRFA